MDAPDFQYHWGTSWVFRCMYVCLYLCGIFSFDLFFKPVFSSSSHTPFGLFHFQWSSKRGGRRGKEEGRGEGEEGDGGGRWKKGMEGGELLQR